MEIALEQRHGFRFTATCADETLRAALRRLQPSNEVHRGHSSASELLAAEQSRSLDGDDGAPRLRLDPYELRWAQLVHGASMGGPTALVDMARVCTEALDPFHVDVYAACVRGGYAVRADAVAFGAHFLLYPQQPPDMAATGGIRQPSRQHGSHVLWCLPPPATSPSATERAWMTRVAQSVRKTAMVASRGAGDGSVVLAAVKL